MNFLLNQPIQCGQLIHDGAGHVPAQSLQGICLVQIKKPTPLRTQRVCSTVALVRTISDGVPNTCLVLRMYMAPSPKHHTGSVEAFDGFGEARVTIGNDVFYLLNG